MAHNYPVLLDVTSRQAVIVGGGEVAARKAEGLLAAEAKRVRVISPAFHPCMPGGVERVVERYRPEHLVDADLVFAATDDRNVNDAVVRDARAMRVLVSRADADEAYAGDFATPAMIRRDPVLITVSTGGSPALAARIRDAVQQRLDPHWIEMATLMQMLRPFILRQSLTAYARRDIFFALASEEAFDVLRSGGKDAVKSWLVTRFASLANLELDCGG